MLCLYYKVCQSMMEGVHVSGDELMMYLTPDLLAESAGKTRIFAIPNTVKQAILRPAHDWCMSVCLEVNTDGRYI